MRSWISLAAALAVAGFANSANAEAPEVVVSIKPLHGLTAAIMEGVAEPYLLLDGTASPHGYSLRPSDAQALSSADMVIWVGPSLETFLTASLDSLAEDAEILTASRIEGMRLLPAREGGLWAEHAHDHDEHGHDEHGHDEHGHGDDHHDDEHHGEEHAEEHHDDEHHGDEHHGHEHAEEHHDDEHHGDEHAEEHHDDEHHGEEHADEHHDDEHHAEAHLDDVRLDGHLWLDPRNAQHLAEAIAAKLSAQDPANAAAYQANLETLLADLQSLDARLESTLAPLQDRPFIVFHDAYQYFEDRYGLAAAGSVTVSPEHQPGARRVSELREALQDRGAVCVFAEPQFSPALLKTLAEGTDVGYGVLDPLGATVDKGPRSYQEMLGGMGDSFVECLTLAG